MTEDPRCCGTGTCIINADGVCWCGQQWDGEKMSFPKPEALADVHTHVPQTESAQEAATPAPTAVPKV